MKWTSSLDKGRDQAAIYMNILYFKYFAYTDTLYIYIYGHPLRHAHPLKTL